MAMTAHPNGSVLNAIWTLCVLMFVSSARGQPLLETIASLCLGQCVCVCVCVCACVCVCVCVCACVCVCVCVQGISWALKHFRANHVSLFLSLRQLFFLSSVLFFLSCLLFILSFVSPFLSYSPPTCPFLTSLFLLYFPLPSVSLSKLNLKFLHVFLFFFFFAGIPHFISLSTILAWKSHKTSDLKTEGEFCAFSQSFVRR